MRHIHIRDAAGVHTCTSKLDSNNAAAVESEKVANNRHVGSPNTCAKCRNAAHGGRRRISGCDRPKESWRSTAHRIARNHIVCVCCQIHKRPRICVLKHRRRHSADHGAVSPHCIVQDRHSATCGRRPCQLHRHGRDLGERDRAHGSWGCWIVDCHRVCGLAHPVVCRADHKRNIRTGPHRLHLLEPDCCVRLECGCRKRHRRHNREHRHCVLGHKRIEHRHKPHSGVRCQRRKRGVVARGRRACHSLCCRHPKHIAGRHRQCVAGACGQPTDQRVPRPARYRRRRYSVCSQLDCEGLRHNVRHRRHRDHQCCSVRPCAVDNGSSRNNIQNASAGPNSVAAAISCSRVACAAKRPRSVGAQRPSIAVVG
eukprot:comp22057_c0_seq4/m.50974 comp22057_c0_seq4/g.50974  ORF comp22057_c0_seq4/g.50974 comp22057_c0_seq4/m.50974 type:complete len:369 (+) comp22057_c0_seq4:503-1609(+)